MKTTKYIKTLIDRFSKGDIFTYSDFMDKVGSKEAVIKALNRMAASGKIAKLSKGKFYKPEKTPFGELQPNQQQVVKDLLEEDGKFVGYLTGLSVYNQLGLTTQVSNTIQIGKNEVRPTFKRGRYTISFIKQKNTITRENIPLLRILDVIKNIKKIPDTTLIAACERLIVLIKEQNDENLGTMARLALKYPPSTRALLGSIYDEIGTKDKTEKLFNSLNPITTYNLSGVSNILPSSQRWNIK